MSTDITELQNRTCRPCPGVGARAFSGYLIAALLGWVLGAPVVGNAAEKSQGGGLDFVKEVRPILSDNCFNCHGPDDKSRKGGLRLDVYEDALKPGKSGKLAIVPGKPDESELLRRLHTHDQDDVMPPPKFGKTLSDAQKATLKRWIAEGAPWKSHWAFETPKRPELPAVKHQRWVRNEIDRFILARLEKEGLKPSDTADKVTLLRRVTLDLTGLPPSPAEIDAFVTDTSPNAYDKAVDRLLQSPRFGEHMARFWLDAARYADSHGYHIDSERQMWKYRDWVVDSFNSNKKFDQFTLEQLAGDLIPNPTLEQKVGSGFVRANMSTGEGGAIVEEYQAKYTFDRTETMGTMWLGLTMTCARCHTHKYDPITHHEYYGLYAFFNNLRESVMDGNAPNPEPSVQVPSAEQSARLAELKGLMESGQKRLDAPSLELDRAQETWERRWKEKLAQGWDALVPAQFVATSNAQHRVLEDQSVLVSGPTPPQDNYSMLFKLTPGSLGALRLETLPDQSLPQQSSARSEDGKFRLSEFEAELVLPGVNKEGKPHEPKKLTFARAIADSAIGSREIEKAIDGKAETGWQPTDAAMKERHLALFVLGEKQEIPEGAELRVRLKHEASVNRRAIGRFRISAARTDELVSLLAPTKPQPWQMLGALKAGADAVETLNQLGEPEKDLDFTKSYPGVRDTVKWTAKGDLEDGRNHVLVGSLHGVHGVFYLSRKLVVPTARQVQLSLRADDVFRVWVNGAQVGERLAKEAPGEGPLRLTVPLKAGENHILVKMVNIQGDSRFLFSQVSLDPEVLPSDVAAFFAAGGTLTAEQKTKARVYFRRATSEGWRKDYDQVEQWREEQDGLNRSIPMTMVAREETEKPRETRMLMRGEYDKPGEVVTAHTPSILTPFPKGAPTNRLGLAQWLVDPKHPLTARVNVNRFWQQVFGIGLVKTTEDFGVQGESPSHPELLDWLATEFIASGWDMKNLMRMMVTSATYRQSSRLTPDLLRRDPENRLLARGPRFRVDGEVVRDTALYVSGLLVDRRGGKSAKPFEPAGLWEAVSFNNSQKYVPDQGEGQYRRSLYTHWKRQSPPPNMLIFDAPTREYCVVRRPRTNTPLQALALLNDPQFVEASRAMAQRMIDEGGKSIEDRLTYGFRLVTSRKPTSDEIRVLRDVLKEQLKAFQADEKAALKFLDIGSFKARNGIPASELAAWSTIASMLMNLDESITKI